MFKYLFRIALIGALLLTARGAVLAADDLAGTYVLVSDSDGTKPKSLAVVTITFSGDNPGVISMSAVQPGETVTDKGKYSVRDNRITIEFAEVEWAGTNQPFQLDGCTLVLPFKALGGSSGSGASTWTRTEPKCSTTPTTETTTSTRDLCDADQPTASSLDAARKSIAAGSTSVKVSPNGCVLFAVSKTGTTTTEQLTYSGKVAEELSYDLATATGRRDADLDGFFEWLSSLQKGETPDRDVLIIEEFSPTDQKLTTRRTYTRSGDVIRVRVDGPNASGVLRELRRFNITSRQPGETGAVSASPPSAAFTGRGCSAADEKLIRDRLKEAIEGDGTNPGGLVCLHRLGVTAQERAVTIAALRPIDIFCDPTQDLMAYYEVSGWFDLYKRTELHINPDKFKKLSPREQKHLLFHEMLHSYALHETDPADIPRVMETDPTEACAETCWGTPLTTRCSCATCLGTDVCDPRCATFKPCNPVLAFRCPCPTRPDFYPDCSKCLVGCPSGLACFGMQTCTPISVECAGTKTTCP